MDAGGEALIDEQTLKRCAGKDGSMGLGTTVRPSLAFYNTFDEIDRLLAMVRKLAAARPHENHIAHHPPACVIKRHAGRGHCSGREKLTHIYQYKHNQMKNQLFVF